MPLAIRRQRFVNFFADRIAKQRQTAFGFPNRFEAPHHHMASLGEITVIGIVFLRWHLRKHAVNCRFLAQQTKFNRPIWRKFQASAFKPLGSAAILSAIFFCNRIAENRQPTVFVPKVAEATAQIMPRFRVIRRRIRPRYLRLNRQRHKQRRQQTNDRHSSHQRALDHTNPLRD